MYKSNAKKNQLAAARIAKKRRAEEQPSTQPSTRDRDFFRQTIADIEPVPST